ncbi:GH36-type glycosyl hydrolase domain-containing protein [Herbaspirillum rhizosphaerae]
MNQDQTLIEEELPLRAELFSAQQMEQHGRVLANAHKLDPVYGPDKLLARLADNEATIIDACTSLTAAIKAGRQVTPAAEWLLDNFYLIEEQIRTAKRHLPKNYSKELPRLLHGHSAGSPRVYDIALETISHGDGRVDPESLSRFVVAYQQTTTLNLGELWAIPIMLRLALIENLRRVAARLSATRINRNLAHFWADDMLEVAEKNPSNLILLVADMARSAPPMESSFVAELVRRLQGQSPTLTLPLTWLAQRLAASGTTIEHLVQQESQHQAADQVSISNSIGSLRFLTSMDWREFVETMSTVDHILREDPSDTYARMDFATRDRYRHVVEKISREGALSETEVAREAIAMAQTAATQIDRGDRRAHVGYYLIGQGLEALQTVATQHVPLRAKLARMAKARPMTMYLGTIFTITALATWWVLAEVHHEYRGSADQWYPLWLALLGLLIALPASQLAQSVVNWLVPMLTPPRLLPRMDLSGGIPPECHTLVVVPTLLSTTAGAEALVDALEVRFLANQDANLRFCLLTDFADATSESMPEDAPLLTFSTQLMAELNIKYPRAGGDSFLLLHRPRRWNPAQATWMAYERKRGKLGDLNAFLRGSSHDAFSAVVGDTTGLVNTRYVITLDTDTELPRDAARQFVATMSHPLNRPVYDAAQKKISDGYGILQPRIAVSSPSAQASRYELLYGGETGIDPYTRTVSDVYQDLFGEGSFIGKGIYDVDAFEQVLQERMPENRILSHDLLEGCYARAGLISDVQLYEQYPSRYSADVSRRHRWIRGDWQIAAWLWPRVPMNRDAKGKLHYEKTPLSALSRWKLFDNLRRSLVAPALTLATLGGWILLPKAWLWTGLVLVVSLTPALCSLLLNLLKKSGEIRLQQHISASLSALGAQLVHAGLAISLLPYESWYHLDAILRTQWRLHISGKRLLEWNSSSEVNARAGNRLRSYYAAMWQSPLLALAVALYLDLRHPVALAAAAPILILWWLAPVIVFRISQPITQRAPHLSDTQQTYLNSLARKTWLFFETYVGPADNWLPPDNMQEHPVEVLARRTSPTNIGLSLLANLTAYDFGYIPGGQLLERTRNTFQTMSALERYQGHFYNWYDTQYLHPLPPAYVSTVDSGNLAGHLLTLLPGLQALADAPVLHPNLFPGLRSAYVILDELSHNLPLPEAQQLSPLFGRELLAACATPPSSMSDACTVLDGLLRHLADFSRGLNQGNSAQIAGAAASAITPNAPPDKYLQRLSQLRQWERAISSQCREALAELHALAPWLRTNHFKRCSDNLPSLAAVLNGALTLRQIAQLPTLSLPVQTSDSDSDENKVALTALQGLLKEGSDLAASRLAAIDMLVMQAAEFSRMEYRFLYDPATHLLAIGYNVTDRRRDTGFYDLLASEARLATFVGIAQGQLPQDSWFALGRRLTIAGGEPILLSWSGSMFEYLMPLLVMPTFTGTLLDQTYRSVVERQISYGAQRGVFWGMSESGYHSFDASLNYQYRTFGVPGLGFKRGLGDDLVIAPYASMMALMVAPEQACNNLQEMSTAGFEGVFGMYEAIDYTPSRLPRGQSNAVIRSFMAHHQGMGFLALAYLLLDRPMQRRFESYPLFQATMSLLHERVPKAGANYSSASELADVRIAAGDQDQQIRVVRRPDPRTPEVQLLSNGRYHVMITSAGGGYSRWNDIAVTRWREDTTRDHWGSFCYVRDIREDEFWSTAYQPSLTTPTHYEVIFSEGRAEFRRNDRDIEMHTEIVVSPEDDIELRRTKITNRSRSTRTLEITSYAEVVLAPAAADAMHPAFSNLFVQTEIDMQRGAILCTRRPRSANENVPWMFHLMAVHGAEADAASYETDRMQFLGRGNTPATPQVMGQVGPLSNSAGSVLDPIMSIRRRITLETEQSVTIDMVTGVAASRDICEELIGKYQDRHLADRVMELAWTHNQVVLRQLNASEADAQLYGRLANSVVYANPLLRAEASILARNRRGQSALWSYAISGDLPIVLVQIRDMVNIELVRQLVQAHAYWRSKGLAVDLVIWNEDHAGYRQVLQEQILNLISSVTGAHTIDRPGGIFVRLLDQISDEDRILFQSVARVILKDTSGTLAEQVARRDAPEVKMPLLSPKTGPVSDVDIALPSAQIATPPLLLLENGTGGFSADGREYLITTGEDRYTPAPWSNVIANAQFGSVVSESGQAYSWAENAHEFRLTPWANDPVSDGGGEAFYLRDEHSGASWSPTPLPRRGSGDYLTRHGFGYSVFEHSEAGIFSVLTMFVALDAPVKYMVLRVRNDSRMQRQLSATGYVEWVLGDLRAKTAMHVNSEADTTTGALLASNHYNTEFPQRVAFFDLDATTKTVTCDRNEFIGRNRSLQNPVAMERQRLSGKIGAGFDPCAAIQTVFDLAPGQERELVFMLGLCDTRHADTSALILAHRGAATARTALQSVKDYWQHTLGTIQVNTPEPALDVLANGWLLYQTLACRMWARSGYYQSGGAFGFRDQLQDSMALVYSEPALVRNHLLLCAAHQFVEGDVQHWWHPPTDRGVRTHCSDDYLWLPLAVHRYVTITGDVSVLSETVSFLQGRAVGPEEDSYYDLPQRSAESASLYQHCVRAIRHGLQFGQHGLSLIGSCDWNDGMDKVGEHGKGESVWLSFFFYEVMMRFADVATLHQDQEFAAGCREHAQTLQKHIEQNGWDGNWYLRAYFDDGSPLGSAANVECQIDSISQSWAVLSGAGDSGRVQQAMQSVRQRLVRDEDKLIQLLDPPFDHSDQNPGYIRGYVPGVRENGGQYTHAAIWTIMAFARMGDHQSAWQLVRMINPINHTRNAEEIANYKVEPYVIAADVYAVTPHTGRGGWTWYTGSAGWMYRLLVESLLGLHIEDNKLTIDACIPPEWNGYGIDYRYGETRYRIAITLGQVMENTARTETDNEPGTAGRFRLDGIDVPETFVTLVDDHEEHQIDVMLSR